MDEPRPWTRADLDANPTNRPDGPDGRGLTEDEADVLGAQATPRSISIDMQDEDDFVCPRCDTEIQLKHLGDRSRIGELQLFRCVCGVEMHFENPRGAEAMGVPMQ